MTTLNLAIGLASLFVAIMVPLVGAVFYVANRLGKLDSQISAYNSTLSALAQAVGGLAAIVPDESRRMEITMALASGLNPPKAPDNPFSHEEAARYNRYIQMAQNGEAFNENQVQDFNNLIQHYKQDHPNDPNLAGLLVLGAFLLGLYLLSRRKN